MSSPRAASQFEGVSRSQDANVGPIQLPAITPADFVLEFNETYARIGLKIESVLDLCRQDSDATEPDFRSDRV